MITAPLRQALITEVVKRFDTKRIKLTNVQLQHIVFLFEHISKINFYDYYTYGHAGPGAIAFDVDLAETALKNGVVLTSSGSSVLVTLGNAVEDLQATGSCFLKEVQHWLALLLDIVCTINATGCELFASIIYIEEHLREFKNIKEDEEVNFMHVVMQEYQNVSLLELQNAIEYMHSFPILRRNANGWICRKTRNC